MNNLYIHPALNPAVYILRPYYLRKEFLSTKREIVETTEDNICIKSLPPFITVKSYNEISSEIRILFNIPNAKINIEPIGEEEYEEGFNFSNSLHITAIDDEVNIEMSVDCFTTFNSCLWGESRGE